MKFWLRAAATLAMAVSAKGYVRTVTYDGIPLHRSDPASVQVYLNTSIKAGSLNADGKPNITGSSNPAAAITAAQTEWGAVASAAVTFAAPQTTALTNDPSDGQFVMTIEDTKENRSVVGSYLAITLWQYAEDGTLLDTDVIYNPNVTQDGHLVPFSTDGAINTYDFQSITVHELGHALGAGHTPVLGATMFQAQGEFSTFETLAEATIHRALSADDIAFVTAAYPAANDASLTGSIAGRVAFQDGLPVLGALVGATDPGSGLVYGGVSSLVDGTFRMDGVPPGSYFVYAQPANGPVNTGNLLLPGISGANTTFRATFAGGNGGPAIVSVAAGKRAYAPISVDPAPSGMQIAFLGTGPPGGSSYDYISGPKALSSGQSFDIDLWGPGFASGITEADVKVFGPGVYLKPGTLRTDSGRIVDGYTPLVFTVYIAPRTQTALVTIAVVNGSDGAMYSGGLVVLGTSSPPPCVFSLSTKQFSLGADGGSGAVDVDTPNGCAWTATSDVPWVRNAPASGVGTGPLPFSVDANPGPGTRSGTLVIGGQPLTIDQRGTAAGPAIGAVVNAATFASQLSPGSFITIFGTNLSAETLGWGPSILDGALPTQLAGFSVRVNGADCFISYVSPTQANVLIPPGISTAGGYLQLISAFGASEAPIAIADRAPGFFANSVNGKAYALGVFANTATMVAADHPAQAGAILELFLNGLGATGAFYPIGEVLSGAYPITSTPVTMTVGGLDAPVLFAGLTYAGLYQVNVQMPGGLVTGDQPTILTVSGVSTPAALIPFSGK